MTPEQSQTLATHIRANTDQAVIDALAAGNSNLLADLYNLPTTTNAWQSAMTSIDLFEETDLTIFDALSAGKRDSWRLMLDFSPVDFTRTRFRKAVVDIWGSTNSIPILRECRRKATVAELVFGSTDATTNTVLGVKLNWEGMLDYQIISKVLNDY